MSQAMLAELLQPLRLLKQTSGPVEWSWHVRYTTSESLRKASPSASATGTLRYQCNRCEPLRHLFNPGKPRRNARNA